MLSTRQIIETEPAISVPDVIEVLRSIIALQENRDVEYAEAEEIGEALVTFFETLADNMG